MKIRWLLIGAVLLGGGIALFVHGKQPDVDMEDMGPLEIGEETTRIEGPIVNGQVDYIAALNAGEPPPADENAAIPILVVLGTEALFGQVSDVLARLGAPGDLPATGTFLPADDAVEEAILFTDPDVEDAAPRAENETITAWIESNRAALDGLVEASRRPRLWCPVVRVREDRTLDLALRPNRLGDVIDALEMRAHIAREQGDLERGWEDVAALLRLHGLVDQLPGTLARMVAYGVHSRAMDWIQAALEDGAIRPAFGEEVIRVLSAMPEPRDVVPDVDVFDRFYVLDAWLQRAQDADGRGLNPSLRAINRSLDRVLALARNLDGQSLQRLSDYVEAEQTRIREFNEQARSMLGRATLVGETILSGGNNASRMTGEVLASMVVVMVPLLVKKVHRCVTLRAMAVTATALRLHATRTGGFPDSLDALVPDTLPVLPTQALSGAPIPYERTETGCRVGDEDLSITLR